MDAVWEDEGGRRGKKGKKGEEGGRRGKKVLYEYCAGLLSWH